MKKTIAVLIIISIVSSFISVISAPIAHKALISGSGLNRISIIDENGNSIWELINNGLWVEVNDSNLLPNGNIVYGYRNTLVSGVRLIKPSYPSKTGYTTLWEYQVPNGGENHTAQPIDNGGFLVGEAYATTVRIVELDKNGSVRKAIDIVDNTVKTAFSSGSSHAKFRQITKTPQGTYLLAHFSNGKTYEINSNGGLVSTYNFGGFTAIKLNNGNVLISGGDTHSIKEFTADGNEVWSVAQNDISGVSIGFAADIKRLSNGNTILANWGGHGGASGATVMEITPDKSKIWNIPISDTNISSAQIIDDLGVNFNPLPDVGVGDSSTNMRSPNAIASSIQRNMIYIADYTDKSILVMSASTNEIIRKFNLSQSPNTLLLSNDEKMLYVGVGGVNGKVVVIDLDQNIISSTISAGHTPTALEVSENGETLYIANRFDNNVQILNLTTGATIAKINVTREPMGMVRVGNKVFVGGHLPTGTANDDVVASDITVIDLTNNTTNQIKLTNGSTALKALTASPDGKQIYATHLVARNNVATTQLDRGWIYTNAISEIDVATNSLNATILIDDIDWGAGNPWGIYSTSDKIFVTASGTREVIVIDRLKMRQKIDGVANGTVNVQGLLTKKADIADDLTFLAGMKNRIYLDNNGPRSVAILGGNAYVGGYFDGKISIVDLSKLSVQNITLSTTAVEESARAGERVWNDATLCFQQWQSCASCHPDARVDALNWDNLNDGIGTPKQVRTMLDTFKRGKVMATGIRPNAYTAVRAGMRYIMFNYALFTDNEDMLVNIDNYIKSLKPEQSPYLVDGKLSEQAERGKVLFESDGGCASCHGGVIKGKDSQIYNFTQIGNEKRGLLVPPLIEVWRTAPYLYDGRAETIYDAIKEITMLQSTKKYTDVELRDIEQYVLSLSDDTSYEFVIEQYIEGNITVKRQQVGGTASAKLFIVAYDQNNKLVDINIFDATNQPLGSHTYPTTVIPPINGYIKAFVWVSAIDMTPLSNVEQK